VIYSIAYAEIVVPLVKAIQELSITVDSLKINQKTTDSLQTSTINSLLIHQATTDSLLLVLQNCCLYGATNITNQNNVDQKEVKTTQEIKLTLPAGIYMSEAYPNPNNGKVEIDYYLPSTVSSAQIIFTDMLGNVINEIKLVNGYGTISVDTQDLAIGYYTFSLVINGKVYDTKKMIRNK